MRPQLLRLNADILCHQEVNGQETDDEPRKLLALQKLIEGTQYEAFNLVSTKTADGFQVYDERNLVILSRYEINASNQYRNDLIEVPMYRKVMANPHEPEAKGVEWERPLLYAKINCLLENSSTLSICTSNLKYLQVLPVKRSITTHGGPWVAGLKDTLSLQ